MLHDLRELLINNPSFFRGKSSFNLIKNNFPLIVQKDDITDFSVNNEYNLEKINLTKIFRQSITYKLKNEDNFEEGELILYNKNIYFGTLIKDDIVKIVKKLKLKSIGLYNNKEENDNLAINILVNASKEESDEEDDVKNDNNINEEKKEEENLHIIIKFNDEKIKNEISRKKADINDNCFGNCLLLFMMLHDLRELLINNPSFFR
jgi:hypothetical protein